jgi:hypothetical protein
VPSSIIRPAGAQAAARARVFATGGATGPVHPTEINDPTLPTRRKPPTQRSQGRRAGRGPLSFDLAWALR